MITYISNLIESLAIALECNELARQGKFEEVRQILCLQETV